MKRSLTRWVIAALVLVIGATVVLYIPRLNGFQTDGTMIVPGISGPVKIMRDGKGMAYIYASTLDDAIMAQGIVTAQDRLFQMQVTRLLAQGRISELVGEQGKATDVKMRTIGIYRNAKKHAEMLDERTRNFFRKYSDGVNWWMLNRPKDLHLEFKLAGIQPEPWDVPDCLTVAYYMGWITSANVETEIMAQMLIDKLGAERARGLFPVNINPDDPSTEKLEPKRAADAGCEQLHFVSDSAIQALRGDISDGIGSNNWAVGPRFSKNGKPVVANDPHLDARILPGIWYPSGIITPKFRAVGVIVPGIPGMAIGRTDRVAMGVTNAYGDCQDLYAETVDPRDPGRYMEGETSLPFQTITEKLKIKDKSASEGYRYESVQIKFTRRGPVVSGVLPGLRPDKVITLRWAAAETMGPTLGFEKLLTSRSAEEVRETVRSLNFIVLNWVFADADGNIGWHVSGKLPIRSQRDSTVPYAVRDSKDNWIGWIPFGEMPHAENPPSGWVGTCNHLTVRSDYPYYYSSHIAPSYRYQRLKQLLAPPEPKSMDDHWSFQRDSMNVMAQSIAPVMARSLAKNPETQDLAQILKDWDGSDDPNKVAPTVFHSVLVNFFNLVFQDELGEDLTRALLHQGYFWKERLQRMVLQGDSPWFDNVNTKDRRETMDDLFKTAAMEARNTLQTRFGSDSKQWLWGQAHQIEFVNPIRRTGFGKAFLGGGMHPMGGSLDTLYCAWYDYDKPFDVVLAASLRMVADLGDNDKIMAVLPGGVCGRTFDAHMKDQTEAFMRGDKVYWWFSDDAIIRNCANTLVLKPQ